MVLKPRMAPQLQAMNLMLVFEIKVLGSNQIDLCVFRILTCNFRFHS